MSKPNVDLDGDKQLRDYGDQTPFYPFGESEADAELVSFLYHDGYKGKAYRAKVLIKTSDTPELVKPGKIYCFHFKLDGNVEQQRAKKKELRQFVAGVMNEDASDEAFKANDAMATLLEASSAEALEGFGLHISSRDRPAVDKDKKPILGKDGKQVVYTNRYFAPLEK